MLIGVLALGLWAFVLSTRVLRLNVMPSVPVGLYALQAVAAPLQPGDLALVAIPESRQLMAAIHGWFWAWPALLKPVAAVAEDVVCRQAGRLQVNGADYGVVYAQSATGLPLPSWLREDSCRILLPFEVFLASPVDRSLDSRYFGAVRRLDLPTRAVPLWIVGGVHAAP